MVNMFADCHIILFRILFFVYNAATGDIVVVNRFWKDLEITFNKVTYLIGIKNIIPYRAFFEKDIVPFNKIMFHHFVPRLSKSKFHRKLLIIIYCLFSLPSFYLIYLVTLNLCEAIINNLCIAVFILLHQGF